VTNDTGAVVARFDYDPYGQAHQTWHSGELDPLTYQPIQFDFLFTGHLHHGRSGLYFAPYRAYDPELGRWISRDPIDTDGGINLYEYVGGDPVNWVDPDGLQVAKEKEKGSKDRPPKVPDGYRWPIGKDDKGYKWQGPCEPPGPPVGRGSDPDPVDMMVDQAVGAGTPSGASPFLSALCGLIPTYEVFRVAKEQQTRLDEYEEWTGEDLTPLGSPYRKKKMAQ
jgi:RHS repeat-associated protein